MVFISSLNKAYQEGTISDKIRNTFLQLYNSYAHSMTQDGLRMEEHEHVFESMLELVKKQLASPYPFEPFHRKITHPYNYFRFGIEFIRPLVDKKRSRVLNLSNVKTMNALIQAGENVIFFANHQTEVDPQLLNLALEETYPELASEVIFVAGDRVLTDPMAVPFSMGCNLLCIYSKRHIDNPPEKKHEKQVHNQRTMKLMKDLLSEGGKCIYVAPSGGRDRPDSSGEVPIAPFDPQSIEMFRLMAKQAKKPVHFYPLALATFDILPPPERIETDVGERRQAKRGGALFSFGNEIDMESFQNLPIQDRDERRAFQAASIWNLVNAEYTLLKKEKS